MVVVLRYVDDDWQIKQQVCRLMLVAKSMTGEEVAHQLIATLSTELSIPANHVVAFMRERASVNNVAMRTVSVLYNSMIDIGCFSHTLDRVGENMNTPILDEFTKHWISLFSHSPKVRLVWRSRTGFSSPSYSATRWWSRFEVIHQMHSRFAQPIAIGHIFIDTTVSNNKTNYVLLKHTFLNQHLNYVHFQPLVITCGSYRGGKPTVSGTQNNYHLSPCLQ
jgi:hypothetical protein